ncbi:MAG: DUF47 domain-containing protein [Raoultibacter sp.]|jgi:predicted phosphate transport protein (TIGR00153 family)
MAKKSKKFDYFDAFERQAELAVKEAKLLIKTIEDFSPDTNMEKVLEKAHVIEHEGDDICHATFTAVATDFITPIEREDIVELSQYLDDILDYIEDVMQRFYMYDIDSIHENTLEFAHIILKGCEALCDAMEDFRNFKKSKNFKQRLIEVNTLENEADAFYMKVTRDMHKKDRDDPLRVLVWTQVFSCMERCTDACEHTADSMRTIMLKNS